MFVLLVGVAKEVIQKQVSGISNTHNNTINTIWNSNKCLLSADARWEFKVHEKKDGYIEIQITLEKIPPNCTFTYTKNNGSCDINTCSERNHKCTETPNRLCLLLDFKCKQEYLQSNSSITRTTIPTEVTSHDDDGDGEPRPVTSAVIAIPLLLLAALGTGWLGSFIWQQRKIRGLRKW